MRGLFRRFGRGIRRKQDSLAEQGEFELQGDFVNGQLVPLRPLADLSHSDLIFRDASLEPARESSVACTAQSFATVEQCRFILRASTLCVIDRSLARLPQ